MIPTTKDRYANNIKRTTHFLTKGVSAPYITQVI